MANAVFYVDSVAGSNTSPYSSWATAATTLAAAITASGTTGSDFYISSGHSESGASETFTFKGASATPDRAFSCDKTNAPPASSDLTAGAAFASTTSSNIIINGYVYIYGCYFTFGSGANTSAVEILNTAPGDITLDSCKLIQGGSSASISQLGASGNTGSRVTLINTTWKFANANSGIVVKGGVARWLNTSSAIDTSGTLPTSLFLANAANGPSIIVLDGVDLSGLSSKAFNAAIANNANFQLVNCKTASSMTYGTPTTAGTGNIDLVVSDNTATTYAQKRVNYMGTLTQSTTIYNNATDGTTPISWQVITTANSSPQNPFECFDIVQWAASGTYGSTKIQMTSATGSLATNDVWVNVEYLGSNYPLASPATTFGVGSSTLTLPQIPQGTSPGTISTGGSWATGALTNQYVLAVPSFTTSVAGYVRFRVKVAKPSLTIYIDPAVTIA